MMALAALGIGSVSTLLVAMSIADPLRQLQLDAKRGYSAATYNAACRRQRTGPATSRLQRHGLRAVERQRLRDLFGLSYVGEDVARPWARHRVGRSGARRRGAVRGSHSAPATGRDDHARQVVQLLSTVGWW